MYSITLVAKVVKICRLHGSSWASINRVPESREANILFSKTVPGYSGYKDFKT